MEDVPLLAVARDILVLMMRERDCEANIASMAAQSSAAVEWVATCVMISLDSKDNR
jgi:hypothetical protein